MYVLGIETSCDETGASVVQDGKKIISNIVSSSLKFHKKYQGVVPEIASRMQLETITAVTEEAIRKARIHLKDIALVSVTSKPGLPGSLLVGVSFAKSISLATGIPLLGVDHTHSHIYANFLNQEGLRLPFVALVVSGGHTSLFYVKDFGEVQTLGLTQDDACGEAFDKVAKILGLGYPGGPFIEKLARRGNAKRINFRCSGTVKPLNFSFSGIKTAVLYYTQRQLRLHNVKQCTEKTDYGLRTMGYGLKCDIAASFQETVIDTLVKKAFLACRFKKVDRLAVGGGVAVNKRLRDKFFAEAKNSGARCCFPSKSLCLDNAAMVAGLGYCLFKKGIRSNLDLN